MAEEGRNDVTAGDAPTDLDSVIDSTFEEAGGTVDNAFDAPPETAPEAAEEAGEAGGEETPAEEAEAGQEAEKASPGEGEEDTAETPETPETPAEEVLNLTPEEMEALKSSPEGMKLYRSLMRASTQKWQEIAGQKKFLDAVQTNPRAVAEQMAQQLGLQIVDPNEPTQSSQETTQEAAAEEAVDDVMEDLSKLFGAEGAQALKPVMERMIGNVMQKQIAPIQQTQEQFNQYQAAQQAESVAKTFRAQHPDITPEIEARMMEIAKAIMPAPGATPDQYLSFLYQTATAGQAPKVAAKEVVRRVKAAAQSQEPSRSTAPAPKKESAVVGGMSIDDAFDAAFEEATAELEELEGQ